MAQKQINARDLIFQVSDGQPAPTWLAVGGITSAKLKWDEHEESVETVTYDDAGEYSEEIMQRGASLKLEGRKKQDSVTAAYDTGQARLDDCATLVGSASQVDVRFRYPNETNWRCWTVTVSRGEEGGGNNDKVDFSYQLTRCGAQTTTAAP